jgi:hypothetical protein
MAMRPGEGRRRCRGWIPRGGGGWARRRAGRSLHGRRTSPLDAERARKAGVRAPADWRRSAQLRHLVRAHPGEMGVHHILGEVPEHRPGERLDRRHLHLQPPDAFRAGAGPRGERPRSRLNGRPPFGRAPPVPRGSAHRSDRAPRGGNAPFISRLETEPSERDHIGPNRADSIWFFCSRGVRKVAKLRYLLALCLVNVPLRKSGSKMC